MTGDMGGRFIGCRSGAVLALALATALAATVTPARAETIALKAELSGAVQVPPNPSKGHGSLTATYDTVTKKLAWEGTFADLTGQPLAAHFHGPADATQNAPITVHIAPPVSPVKGEATLTDAQAAEVVAGRWYVNIHTPSYPGGELRGQVRRTDQK